MKQLFIVISLLFARTSMAQTCVASSDKMKQYYAQKTWKPVSVQNTPGVPPIKGYVDEQNRFYFDDLTRNGFYEVKLSVDPLNKGYANFFSYCGNAKEKGKYLRLMRKRGEGNKYSMSVRFLPTLDGFSNKPLAGQNFKALEPKLKFSVSPESILETEDYNPLKVAREFASELSKQLQSQSEFGLVELDLTGYDDLVCDLIQGNANLGVEQSATSTGPLVQQKVEFNSADIFSVYNSLSESLTPEMSKEERLFVAGRTLAQLQYEGKTATYSNNKAFEILGKVVDVKTALLTKMDDQSLSCVADQMQTYKAGFTQHFFSVEFKFPTLGKMASEVGVE